MTKFILTRSHEIQREGTENIKISFPLKMRRKLLCTYVSQNQNALNEFQHLFFCHTEAEFPNEGLLGIERKYINSAESHFVSFRTLLMQER